MISIKNKNALVTGSSRGIGQQIVQGLANLGCNVIVHGRTKESCAATLQLLEKYPVQTYCVYGELSEEAGVQSIIQQVQALNIPIDILYNNAAVMTAYKDDILTHTWDEWMLSMRVNVFAMYTLCAAFIPGMQARGFGRIVNLSSGIMYKPELAPYGSSKWAVNKLTEDLSVKMGTGVRINYLDPCWLQTDMGGPDADYPVQAVLPGALAPVLVEDDGPNGVLFRAIE